MATTYSLSLHGVSAAEVAAFVDLVAAVSGDPNTTIDYNPAEATLSYSTPQGHTVSQQTPSARGDTGEGSDPRSSRGRNSAPLDLMGDHLSRVFREATDTAVTRRAEDTVRTVLGDVLDGIDRRLGTRLSEAATQRETQETTTTVEGHTAGTDKDSASLGKDKGTSETTAGESGGRGAADSAGHTETPPGTRDDEDSFGASWFSTPPQHRWNNGHSAQPRSRVEDRRNPFAGGDQSEESPEHAAEHPFEKHLHDTGRDTSAGQDGAEGNPTAGDDPHSST